MNDYLESFQFLQEFQAGKEAAQKAFFTAHWSQYFLYAFQIVQDHEQARDINQESFTKLFTQKRPFSSYQNIRAHLRLVVRNACIDYLRTKKLEKKRDIERTKVYLELTNEPGGEEAKNRTVLLETIYTGIEDLPETQKLVLTLIYTEGLRVNEVANRLNIAINEVRNIKSAGIYRLRKIIPPALMVSPSPLFLLFFCLLANI